MLCGWNHNRYALELQSLDYSSIEHEHLQFCLLWTLRCFGTTLRVTESFVKLLNLPVETKLPQASRNVGDKLFSWGSIHAELPRTTELQEGSVDPGV